MNNVTYPQALALKELGFDMPVRDYYHEGKIQNNSYPNNWNVYLVTSAPFRSEVLEWAREKKGMFGNVRMFTDGMVAEWGYVIEENPSGYYLYDSIELGMCYPTHAEAETALINKIIEILKTDKTEGK